MKKFVPALLGALALMSATCQANAQLVVGNDNANGQLWVIDIVNSGTATRQLVSGTTAQVRGIAADNTNNILYWLDGSSIPQSLYRATMTTSGTLSPVLVGILRIGVTNVAPQSLAYDTVAGKLYAYHNSNVVATEGFYEVNVIDATMTVAYLPGVTAGEATGFDYDSGTDAFYYTNDLTTVSTFSPNGRGLYRLSKPLTAPIVTFVTAYTNADTDIDGLAMGNGRAYFVNDNGPHYVYNLTTNVYETNIPQTFTSTGAESGGAWAPGLVPAAAAGSNVAVTISDSPDPLTIPPGGNITYVITATNFGPDPATGVNVTGTLPGNVTFSSVTAPGTHNLGVISASFGTLASGASGSITVVVNGPAVAPATVTYTVNATTTSTDPFLSNNTATATTAVAQPPANLAIVVVDAPTTLVVPPGGEITFTATINNTVAGNNDANNVVVTATVPIDYDFVSVTAPGTYDAGTRVITANLGTVTFGSSPQIIAVVSRTAPVVGSLTITFPWSVTSSAADPVLTNNVDNETTIIRETQAALSITNVDSPDPLLIPPGGNINYLITVTNGQSATTDPNGAENSTVTGTLPTGVTFVSIDPPGTYDAGTRMISTNLGTVFNGSPASFNVVVSADAVGTVVFPVTVSTTTFEPTLTNNTATATTTIGTDPPANLAIVVIDAPATLVVPPGGEITFTATVNNTAVGNFDADNVVVTATVPIDYDFVGVTAPGTYDAGTRVITANLGTVTFGSSPQIIAVVSRTAPVVGSLTITFPWSVTSSATDPVLTNNVDNETTIIREPQAALTITNVDSPDPVVIPPGGNINYLITVTNGQSATTDPNGAANSTVTGTLPTGVTFVSIDPPGTYDAGTRMIATNLGTVFNGSPASFNVLVSADAIGSVVFPVTVSTTTLEPTTTNNTATATTTIRGPQANLGVAIVDPSDCAVSAGQNFSYTVNVTNAGTETGNDIVLDFTLPSSSDATFVSSSPSIVPLAGVITYNIGTLASGDSASLTVNMTAITAGATLSSSATVAGSSVDPTPANNSTTQNTLISSGGGPTTAVIKGVISTRAGSSSSDVPGIPGAKFSGNFMNTPYASPDGTKFIQLIDSDLPTTSDALLVVSNNGVLSVVVQEGSPIAGIAPAVASNLVQIIDTKASINNAGNYAFSGDFAGTASDDFVVKNVGGVFSLVIDEDTTPSSTIVAGSTTWNDIAGNVTISPAPGNLVTFNATVNDAPATTLDSALVRDDGAVALAVEGVTTPGNLGAGTFGTWQFFSSTDLLGLSFDATHTNWTIGADTDDVTTLDNIAVRNGDVVIQEGFPFTGASGVVTTINRIRTSPNGDWLASFTGTGSIIHIVRNGAVILKTGDLVPGGNGETFNRTTFGVVGNANGDYVYGVETTEPDVLRDGVLVLNNTTVIARQNDPIDLNNDGIFNDDAFIRTIENDNMFMSNTDVYVTVTLRNTAAAICFASDTTASGAALIRIPLPSTVVFPARCNGADIAYDNGDFLPRAEIVDGTNGTPAIPGPFGGVNNGVTEADYNVFFANFFDANAVADIANDDGTSRVPTPAPTTVVNNGVTEGDYNYFFSVFFDGCSL